MSNAKDPETKRNLAAQEEERALLSAARAALSEALPAWQWDDVWFVPPNQRNDCDCLILDIIDGDLALGEPEAGTLYLGQKVEVLAWEAERWARQRSRRLQD